MGGGRAAEPAGADPLFAATRQTWDRRRAPDGHEYMAHIRGQAERFGCPWDGQAGGGIPPVWLPLGVSRNQSPPGSPIGTACISQGAHQTRRRGGLP